MTTDAMRGAAEVCRARPALTLAALTEDDDAWHLLIDRLVLYWEQQFGEDSQPTTWLRQVAIWTLQRYLSELSAVDRLALLGAA